MIRSREQLKTSNASLLSTDGITLPWALKRGGYVNNFVAAKPRTSTLGSQCGRTPCTTASIMSTSGTINH